MARKAKLCLVDGSVLTDSLVIGQRNFTNNKVTHLGTTYDIIKVIRPDLKNPAGIDPLDATIRLCVKEAT